MTQTPAYQRLVSLPAFLTAAAIVLCLASPARAQDNDMCFACHSDPGMTGSAGDTIYVDQERWRESIHGAAELECVSCHIDLAGFEDWPHAENLERVDCSMCHYDAREEWDEGIHAHEPGQSADGVEAATCADCHGSHYISPADDPLSRVYPTNLPYTCLECHGSDSVTEGHEEMGEPGKVRAYLESVHGRALEESGLVISATCSSCHGSHGILPLDRFYEQIPRVCGDCHAGIYDDYLQGVHGEAFVEGNHDVPICTDCHGEHNIMASGEPESTINPTRIAQTCSGCHEDKTLTTKYGIPAARLKTYQNTYHGIALGLGDASVANCGSCHGYHNIRPSSDPESTVHPDNLAETCGQCHPNASENFAEGKIHIEDRPEDNILAWLIKRFYVVFIIGLIGAFIAYIIVDLRAHRRRARGEQEQQPSDSGDDSKQ